MKNTFYIFLKALFVIRIFNSYPDCYGYVVIGLIRNLWLLSKLMTPETGKEIIDIAQYFKK